MRDYPEVKIALNGYADLRGNEKENLEKEKSIAIEKSDSLSEKEQKVQEKLESFQELYDSNQKMLSYGRKINELVKLVGTTIVCLPHTDAGGYGPKVEGFFFMVDNIGLNLLKSTILFLSSVKDMIADCSNFF